MEHAQRSSNDRTQRVLSDAMSLTEDERLDVATALLASLDGPEDDVEDDAWLAEVRRRAERVERGESQSVSWDEAKAHVLQRLRSR